MNPTLCLICRHQKLIISGKGSRFLLCQYSEQDKRYAKYPPQPVLQCHAFDAGKPGESVVMDQ